MDAIDVLVAQHRLIGSLFKKVELETDRRRLTNAVSRLAEELIAHLAAEETVFYPALRQVLDDGCETGERSCDDHLALRIELRRMLEASVADASFSGRISGMRKLFEQHARLEEGELFPRFAKVASKSHVQALGNEIVASRPPVWIVTTEGRGPATANAKAEWTLPSRVSLPIPARR
jgi:hemerythrin superfamily protein